MSKKSSLKLKESIDKNYKRKYTLGKLYNFSNNNFFENLNQLHYFKSYNLKFQ